MCIVISLPLCVLISFPISLPPPPPFFLYMGMEDCFGSVLECDCQNAGSVLRREGDHDLYPCCFCGSVRWLGLKKESEREEEMSVIKMKSFQKVGEEGSSKNHPKCSMYEAYRPRPLRQSCRSYALRLDEWSGS